MPRRSSTSSPNRPRLSSIVRRFTRKLYTTLPSSLRGVTAASGDEFESTERSVNGHSTIASGCSAALFVLMMAA